MVCIRTAASRNRTTNLNLCILTSAWVFILFFHQKITQLFHTFSLEIAHIEQLEELQMLQIQIILLINYIQILSKQLLSYMLISNQTRASGDFRVIVWAIVVRTSFIDIVRKIDKYLDFILLYYLKNMIWMFIEYVICLNEKKNTKKKLL